MATDMNMFVYVATLDPKCRSEGMKAECCHFAQLTGSCATLSGFQMDVEFLVLPYC